MRLVAVYIHPYMMLADNCASTPCKNGANCTNGLNIFSCNCTAGYEGYTCNQGRVTLITTKFLHLLILKVTVCQVLWRCCSPFPKSRFMKLFTNLLLLAATPLVFSTNLLFVLGTVLTALVILSLVTHKTSDSWTICRSSTFTTRVSASNYTLLMPIVGNFSPFRLITVVVISVNN